MKRGGECAQETSFFRSWNGSWDSEYGNFFLQWYSGALLEHGEALMAAAAEVFHDTRPRRPSRPLGGGGGGGLNTGMPIVTAALQIPSP